MEITSTTLSYAAVIISIISAVITSVTTFIAYNTLETQKIHNRKSLRPIVNVNPFDYSNCIKIELRNEGVGPAIIRKIVVSKNEHEKKNTIYEWMPDLPSDLSYSEYLNRYENIPMVQGKIIDMLLIKIDKSNSEQVAFRERMRGILRQLTVELKYVDVYDTEFEFAIKLDLYSRQDNG